MKALIITLLILSINGFAQKKCNIDKYNIQTNVKVDSNKTYIYYTSDDKLFIAFSKTNLDTPLKYLFEKRILNFNALLDITPNVVIIGAPQTKKDSLGKTSYYSIPAEKFLDYPTHTYLIKSVKTNNVTKHKFNLSIKVDTEQFTQHFEIEYFSKKPTKKYKTFSEMLDNSKMTCIYFSGTEF